MPTDETESHPGPSDTAALLASTTTKMRVKDALPLRSSQGCSYKEREHDKGSNFGSTPSYDGGSGRLAENLSVDNATTRKFRSRHDDHDSSRSPSEPTSLEEIRRAAGDGHKVRPVKPRRATSGAIWREKEKRWQVTAEIGKRPDGRRNRKVFYEKTIKVAVTKKEKFIAARQLGVVSLDDKTSFVDFANHYLSEIASPRCRPHIVNQYRHLLRRHVFPRIGQMALIYIRGHHIESSEDELVFVLSHLSNFGYDQIFRFMLHTAVRRGEALAVRWSDLVETGGTWSVSIT